jgi:ABC-type transport system substrate-binding protein
MKTSRLSRTLFAAAIAGAVLVGCKQSEPAPAPTPAPTAEPAPAATAPATVSSVTLGNAIGTDNTIATPLTTFAAGDTIHASVATDGGTAGSLTARWTHVDSDQVVHEETRQVPAGQQVTEFRISKPDGWPTGRYRLDVSLDGNPVQASDFEVR